MNERMLTEIQGMEMLYLLTLQGFDLRIVLKKVVVPIARVQTGGAL